VDGAPGRLTNKFMFVHDLCACVQGVHVRATKHAYDYDIHREIYWGMSEWAINVFVPTHHDQLVLGVTP